MPGYFTRSEAAKRLGISRRQLYTWLQGLPKSERLSEQDIAALAQKHTGKALPAPAAPADQGEQIAALWVRIEALERSASSAGALSSLLQEVLQRIEALESRPQPAAPPVRSAPASAPWSAAPAAPLDATRPASMPRPIGPGASMERRVSPLPPPVRMLVAAWIADHGGPAANTVRRWLDMPLEPAGALRYTQQKIAALGYRAHGAQLHRCENAQCICWQVLPE